MGSREDRSEIAFFDLETTNPTQHGQVAILEFGSILVCPRSLVELERYNTLVRPHDRHLKTLSDRANGITVNALTSAPTFSDIADRVYDILHGRVWAGHNIVKFDCETLREAYAQINRPPPEPKGTIDSWPLLTHKFGRRAGDMKMASLAAYFGLGQQTHRSLDDVRMNLEVIKSCATVLFLEPNLPGISEFVEPDKVCKPLIAVAVVTFFDERQRIQILHKDIPMQIHCDGLRVRFGLSPKYPDRLRFVVDANSSSLCDVLDTCDNIAKRSVVSDSNSNWIPVVSRKYKTIRLNLPTEAGDTTRWTTEIYHKESTQQLVSSRYELDALLRPGFFVDAYFSLDPYNYPQNAGIRLVAKKLIVHTN